MKATLYHYSVDSYTDGKSLINDFRGQFRFAEPYLLALQQGRSTFDAVYLSTMYLSREVCALKLRKYENYQKDAVEGIFEFVRRTQFGAEAVSRVGCVYYCEQAEEALQYLQQDCLDSGLFTKEQVCLLQVEVDTDRVRRYDQQYFNLAQEAIARNEIDAVFQLARLYFSGSRTEKPLIEVLCDGANEVIRRLPVDV